MNERLTRLVGPLFLVLFVGGVLLHGTTLEAVRVQLLPGAEEPRDGGVLGVGGSAPDYRLVLELGRREVECGTLEDTPVGEGLRFPVPGGVPRAAVVGLRLEEDDPADDDVLEELQVKGDEVEGVAYRFVLEEGWSLGAGIEWFLETPLGAITAVGLVVVVVVWGVALAMRGAGS